MRNVLPFFCWVELGLRSTGDPKTKFGPTFYQPRNAHSMKNVLPIFCWVLGLRSKTQDRRPNTQSWTRKLHHMTSNNQLKEQDRTHKQKQKQKHEDQNAAPRPKIQDPRSKTQDPRPKTQDPRPKTQDSRFRTLDPTFYVSELNIEKQNEPL